MCSSLFFFHSYVVFHSKWYNLKISFDIHRSSFSFFFFFQNARQFLCLYLCIWRSFSTHKKFYGDFCLKLHINHRCNFKAIFIFLPYKYSNPTFYSCLHLCPSIKLWVLYTICCTWDIFYFLTGYCQVECWSCIQLTFKSLNKVSWLLKKISSHLFISFFFL